jgi:hypothetical protein
MFENPPTKKNTGITWKTHVSSHAPLIALSTLPSSHWPFRRVTTAMVQ